MILPEKLPDLTWTGFNYARGAKGAQPGTGVHFFVDDYQFRAVWESPVRYAILEHSGILGVVL